MLVFFFFKQKTAYEMRISDWSSDVCSSDLVPVFPHADQPEPADLVGRRPARAGARASAARRRAAPLSSDPSSHGFGLRRADREAGAGATRLPDRKSVV